MDEESEVKNQVKEYYGKTLTKTEDLKTDVCVATQRPAAYLQDALKEVHEAVHSRYYGCGVALPVVFEGATILDLGSGAGRDCFALSKLVGPNGKVIGVDMTEEQVQFAQSYVEYHTKKFGYAKPNVEFRMGFIEDLTGIPDNSVDVVISNCVVNLSPKKDAVLREVFRVLKEGGEMYFSDMYSDRRVGAELKKDPVLWGEGLGGASYWNDFIHLAQKTGFSDPRLVSDIHIKIRDQKIEAQVGSIRFYSATYRLWKIAGLGTDCEDYGQAVLYNGSIPTAPHTFTLDAHHSFPTGKVVPVCRNTFLMLKKTRFAPHFQFFGNDSVHLGIFQNCGKNIPFASAFTSSSSGANQPPKSTGGCC